MLIAVPVLVALMAGLAHAADAEFDGLVSGIEQRYQIRHEHIPLLGFISFCARISSGGGVRGFRVADFENTGNLVSADDVEAFVHGKLGNSWSVILRSHERETKDDTIIYASATGNKFVVLIAAVKDGQLSLVKLGINANRLPKWLNDQEKHSTN